MPTKHKRKRDDKSDYNLPPTTKARSLPVIAPTKDFLTPRKKQKLEDSKSAKPRRKKTAVDDTPKSFARLMAWHKQGKKIGGGLDDGSSSSSSNKTSKKAKPKTTTDTSDPSTKSEIPKILPGETLAQYGIRVDQSLPLSSMPKSNVNPNQTLPADLIEKEKKSKYLTKHNKKLARVQSEWRKVEAKLKDKEEEEAEENAEKLEEERLLWDGIKTTGKKGKKKVVDDDPWKDLEKKRRAEQRTRKGEGLGLNAKDQVQAPPELGPLKLNPFKQKA